MQTWYEAQIVDLDVVEEKLGDWRDRTYFRVRVRLSCNVSKWNMPGEWMVGPETRHKAKQVLLSWERDTIADLTERIAHWVFTETPAPAVSSCRPFVSRKKKHEQKVYETFENHPPLGNIQPGTNDRCHKFRPDSVPTWDYFKRLLTALKNVFPYSRTILKIRFLCKNADAIIFLSRPDD